MSIKIAYSGVMGGQNGFTKALASVCDHFIDIPVSQANTGLKSLESVDIVFLQPQNTGIAADTLQHLKNIGAWVCNWTGDLRDNTPAYCFEYAKYVDITCFSNMRDVVTMREAGYQSDFLQIGADHENYYPDTGIQKDIPIVFMGNNYGHFPLSNYRKQMVLELKREFGNDFKAYGIGQPDGNFMGNQKGEADIYRRAKIGINLSHYDCDRYTSDRMFRMLLSGVCVLSHNYNNWQKDFIHGDNILIWNDFNHLKDLIKIALSDNLIINNIASEGHNLAFEKYTFKSMCENIIELWKANKK